MRTCTAEVWYGDYFVNETKISILPMMAKDAPAVLDMMRVFYASPAVLSNGSEEIFRNDIEACVSDNPYASGYVLRSGEQMAGYAMLAHSFSTESGAPCVWVEDLYLLPEFRGQGIGSAFLKYVREQWPQAVLRLEAERGNVRAISAYEKNGYKELPYMELMSLPDED